MSDWSNRYSCASSCHQLAHAATLSECRRWLEPKPGHSRFLAGNGEDDLCKLLKKSSQTFPSLAILLRLNPLCWSATRAGFWSVPELRASYFMGSIHHFTSGNLLHPTMPVLCAPPAVSISLYGKAGNTPLSNALMRGPITFNRCASGRHRRCTAGFLLLQSSGLALACSPARYSITSPPGYVKPRRTNEVNAEIIGAECVHRASNSSTTVSGSVVSYTPEYVKS